MQKKGFTLIELMIVIAIIAILASILVPNFLKARSQGQYNACIQNIKNVSIALEMYKTEYWDFPTTSTCKTKIVPDYIKTWPKCPAGGTYDYERCDDWSGSYTKQEFCVYCLGAVHKGAGVTSDYRPYYDNKEGWYLK